MKIVNIILVILIIILASGVIIKLSAPPEKDDYCVPPNGSSISTDFAGPTGNISKNNGGWSVDLEAYSGCVVDYKKLTIQLQNRNQNLIWEQHLAQSEARLVHSTIEGPIDSAWYLFGDKDPYFIHDGKRTLLDNNNLQLINESELRTLESVKFVIVEKSQDIKHHYTPGDRIIVFKDFNGDGIDEVKSGSELDILWAGSQINGVALE